MSNIFNYMGPLVDDMQGQFLTLDPVYKLGDPRALEDNFRQPLDSAALLKAIKNKELNDLYSNPTFQAQTLGLGLAGDLLNKTSDYLLSRTEDDLNINDVQDRIYGSTWGDIFNQSSNRQEINSTINNNIRTFDDVRNNANLSTLWDNNDYQFEVNKLKPGEQVGAVGMGVLGGAAKWASTATKINPVLTPYAAIAGGLINGVKSLTNVLQGNNTADMTNMAINRANNIQLNNYFDQARSNRRAMYRNFDEGGPMESLNGLTFFNTGGSHGSNPLGGIPQGIDSEGIPNLVEQGEVKYNDYIFSSRNKASERLLKKYNLPKNLAGKTFAEIATKLQEDSQERPYDPVSVNGLEDSMNKLMAAQEEVRARKANRNNTSMQELENIFAGGGPFTGKFSKNGKAAVRQGVNDTRRLANQIRNTNYLYNAPNSINASSSAREMSQALKLVKQAPLETFSMLSPVNQPWMTPRSVGSLPILTGVKALAGRTAADAILYSTTIAPLLAAIDRYSTDKSNYKKSQQLDKLDKELTDARRALEEQGYNAVEANNIIYSELGSRGFTSYGRQEIPEEYIDYAAVDARNNSSSTSTNNTTTSTDFDNPEWNNMSYRERIQYAQQVRNNRRAAGVETNPILDAAQQNINAGRSINVPNAIGAVKNRRAAIDDNAARNSNEEMLYGEQANYLQQNHPEMSRREALLAAKKNPNIPKRSAPPDREDLNLYARQDNTMPSDLKNAGFYYKDAQNYMRAHNLPFTVENYKRAYNQMRLSGSPDEFRKSGVNAPLRNGYGAKPITNIPKPKNQNNKEVTNIESEGVTTYKVTSNKGKVYNVKANSPEEAKETLNTYLANKGDNTYGSTRTSVKVSEKVRVPVGSKVGTSTTSRKKEIAQAPELLTPEEKPAVTPQQNISANITTEPEYDVEPEINNITTPTPSSTYRRNPFATAAMMAPAIGSISQALTDALGITNRPDYYVEQGLRRNASELNPIAPKLNTDYQEYRPYDVNLMNNQLLAQEYGAQRAARENFNKHTQAAQLLALNNAFGNMGFLANLQAQQANDAKRNATLQWNHGINKENAATIAAYDEINQGIKQQRLNMLNQAIQAKDASDTARAQVTSANRAAALTDLGSLGRYINDTNLTQALINSGVFGKLNTDMSDAYGNLQLFNLFR